MALARQIAKLPESSRSILRSTTIITSLPQMISELVQNSLDAGASHIDIGVDIEQWQSWVRDDGSGIDRSGMNILANGGEEGRYGSSKAYSPASLNNVSTFGFRGEALASIADISCLEISSRSSTSHDTWSVILKGGKKLYSGTAIRWRREKPGTTVFIRDAFYNLPIRRLSHTNPTRTLELIRKDLESVALVFPGVAFSLENSAKEKVEGNGKGRVLTIPMMSSSLSVFRHLFGRALCENVNEIDVHMGEMRIQGFLSMEGALSKAHQYLYLNRHVLSPCDLHRVIDARFSGSSFGKHALDEAGGTRSLRPGARRSPRKNERRPVYVLNVTVPSRCVDNCLEPAKARVHLENQDAVASFISSVVQSFLVQHGFSSSNKSCVRTQNVSPSPRKRRKVVSSEESIPASWTSTPTVTNSNSRGLARRRVESDPVIVDPTADRFQELQWADKATGRISMVDIKTGNSYPLNATTNARHDYDKSHCSHEKERTLVDTRWLRKKTDRRLAEDDVPDWIQQALEGWINPTFGLEEPGVPSLTSFSSFSRQPWLQPQLELGQQNCKYSRFFNTNLVSGRKSNANDATTSFDKTQLRCAEVVGQVDNKFIACLITDISACTKTLILVDQHAADERVRVERFLSVLCQGFLEHSNSGGIKTREMQPAVPVLLTKLEAKVLTTSQAYRQAFARWGFRFAQIHPAIDPEQDRGIGEYVQVLVETVPEIVSEKLLLGDELRELVKGFLAKLEAEGDTLMAAPNCSPETNWIMALRWCPRGLLDVVNSKACRGAIMFNDTLDIGQCQKLVLQLSDTVWPFMCAHGRPSLVPLTNIVHDERKQSIIDWSNFA